MILLIINFTLSYIALIEYFIKVRPFPKIRISNISSIDRNSNRLEPLTISTDIDMRGNYILGEEEVTITDRIVY